MIALLSSSFVSRSEKPGAAVFAVCLAMGCVISAGAATGSKEPTREQLAFFEKRVRPLLSERCFECHGPEKQKAGLRLDHIDSILEGGESGPAVVAGVPGESRMIRGIQRTDPDFEMPPKKALSKREVETLTEWVAMGAPWPAGEARVDSQGREFTDEERHWWAIQPVTEKKIPMEFGAGWARNEIDRFVARKHAEANLAPAAEAEARELVRRAYFGLHGLPPTPEQVAAFVNDRRPDAWERLIDSLLASPRYGERWAQHWLDVVRWAESDGYRQDAFRPRAWPYRDYVIRSFNGDKPYDQFVREQLAGDEIDPDDPDVYIGTAFLRNGIYEYNQRNVHMHWELIVDELTALTGDVFLGLGIGCAQCHDHKFDPLLHEDYYRMRAFLAPVRWRFDLPLATLEERRGHDVRLARWEAGTAEIRAQIDAILEPKIAAKKKAALEKFPEDIQSFFAKEEKDRSPYEQQLVELADIQLRYERERFDEKKSLKEEERKRLAELRAELAKFEAEKPEPLPNAFVATDIGPKAPQIWLKKRTGKTEIAPGFPSILDPAAAVIPASKQPDSTGHRLALANWITQRENPLSTRVIVNRIWQHHFGKGIVPTPNDFGTLGEEPSHPELLDWLTMRFLDDGWRMKPMHKRIMMSAAYRQTARREPAALERSADPGNRLLWRFPPRRLDAEEIRDAMLSVSGEVTHRDGGPSVDGSVPARSVYVKKIRNTPDAMLKGFDAPTGFGSEPDRISTTTAMQSLLLTNGEWTLARAQAFARRLLKDETDAASTMIDRGIVDDAFGLAFGRAPSASEKSAALGFLEVQAGETPAMESAAGKFPGETGLRPIGQMFGKASGVSLGGKALWLQPGSRFERLDLEDVELSADEFTVEAVAVLDNVHGDASVNTLVSRWNGNQETPGWTFGVTSQRSRYDPRNFIVQLTGQDFQDSPVYEVVASGLRFPTGVPVYFAAAVSAVPSANDATAGSVTFYMKDLSDPKAEMQSVTVKHSVVQDIQTPGPRFLVGGRDQAGHLWDGQLARLAISEGILTPEQLLPGPRSGSVDRVLDWMVMDENGENPAPGATWLRSGANGSDRDESSPRMLGALTDFCHALLNSNEFQYLH